MSDKATTQTTCPECGNIIAIDIETHAKECVGRANPVEMADTRLKLASALVVEASEKIADHLLQNPSVALPLAYE